MSKKNRGSNRYCPPKENLASWLELPSSVPEIIQGVGITKQGTVYHLVQLGKRHIARPLSGTLRFQKVLWAEPGILLALDLDNMVYAYSGSQWTKSPLKRLAKRGAILWAAVSASLHLGLMVVAPELLPSGDHLSFSLLAELGVLIYPASAMLAANMVLRRYEYLNTHPNGFVPLNFQFTNDPDLQSRLPEIVSRASSQQEGETHFDPSQWQQIPPPMPEGATQEIAPPDPR